MRLKITLALLFVLGFISINAQDNNVVKLKIQPTFGKTALTVNEEEPVILDKSTDLQITKLKFYLSHFELYNDEKLVFSEEKSFHLVDASDKKTLEIPLFLLKNLVYNSIKFNVGIDKETNNNGIQGGDLDPTKGMYWAWQTGYINFKLEGTSNLSNARKNEFTFHIGGFLEPFYNLKTVTLKVKNTNEITIIADVQKLISNLDLSVQNSIMTPSKESVELSEKIAQIFQLQP